ncbi:MAG TPA: respiratory nitrate reductase subunit gamma [Spirochaetia bacterium]|nr:respiratory nitrate reductase subunit gamma [Spirochaetia bacterium]
MPSVSDAVSAATQAAPQATEQAAQAVSGATQATTQAATDAVSSASHAAAVAGGPLASVYYFIMVPMVYLAILALVVGVVWRIVVILRSPLQPYPLTVYPAARLRVFAAFRDAFGMRQVRQHKPFFWVFLVMFHAAFILLILAHIDIIPATRMLPAASKHMLGAGSVGVALTVSLMYFILRRFRSPVRELSTPGDYLLLLLLLFLFLLGDMISWSNSWGAHGFVMTKKDFALYFDGLARFTFADPRAVLHGSHYHFVVAHVLLANVFFIVLPFTKIVHTFFTIPINLLRRK